MTVLDFDRAAHRREKIRRLERENEHLERQRARLERILGLALKVATTHAGCDELDLLKVLEELDLETERRTRPWLSHEEWLELLRPLPCELVSA